MSSPDDLPEPNSDSKTVDRPLGVTIFAILNVLFGLAGVGGFLVTSLVSLLSDPAQGTPNPIEEILSVSNPILTVLEWVNVVFSAALIASGIALFKMRPVGRTLSLVYAFYSIGYVALSNALRFPLFYKVMLSATGGGEDAEAIAQIAAIIFTVVIGFIGLLLPTALLIYFLRAAVKAKF
ncbi:MAG: hypothetical protein AAGG48_09680 [Planctomycetota bacterium]